jgi:hypothetical protein
MKSSTKWLIGFGSAVALLVILAIVLVLALPGERPLPPENTPEGVVMRYFKALEEEDYREAYSCLSEAARADKEWVATFDSWMGYSHYPGQQESVWKVTIIEINTFDLTASVEIEISSFEPNAAFSVPVYSYREVYRLDNTESGWKIREPLDIPWQIR